MNSRRTWMYIGVVAWAVSLGADMRAFAEGEPPQGVQAAGAAEIKAHDRSGWQVRHEDQALERTLGLLGLDEEASIELNASVAVLEEDKTPHLSEQLVGRPLWHVVVRDWHLVIKSVPSIHVEIVPRIVTADVYLDPLNGKILKITTRWAEGVPQWRPEVSAEEAAAQMARSGGERFHGFPSEDPQIDFLDAIDSIWREAAGDPLGAKQIVARYVLWSNLDKEPKPVWAVMLRGVRPRRARHLFREETLIQYTYIIDAMTGAWISSGNIPHAQRP